MPPAPPVWQGAQAMGLPTAAHTQGLPGQYGLPTALGPLGGGALTPPAATTPLAPGNQHGGAPLAPGTQQGVAPLAPQAPGTQQGGAQIAVQPPAGGGAGEEIRPWAYWYAHRVSLDQTGGVLSILRVTSQKCLTAVQ